MNLCPYMRKRKASESTDAVPSGGPVRSTLTPQQRLIKKAVAPFFKEQGNQVAEKFAGETPTVTQVRALLKPYDKQIADALAKPISPSYIGGARQGLKELATRKRFGKGCEATLAQVKSFIQEKAPKAPKQEAWLAEWIEDPDVIDAIWNENFKFARELDDTTASKLQWELADAMESGESITQIKARIQDITDEWAEGWRAEMIARAESARAYSSGHVQAWKKTGLVDRKMWIAAMDACPFCLDLHETVVELEEPWMEEGDEQDVTWRKSEISLSNDYSDLGGPPRHPNCRCALVPVLEGEDVEDLNGEAWEKSGRHLVVGAPQASGKGNTRPCPYRRPTGAFKRDLELSYGPGQNKETQQEATA